MHIDERDLGQGAKLLGGKSATAAGVEIVNGCENGKELLQFVHVFSYGCTQFEALAAVGIEEGDCSFAMQGPHVPSNEGVR